MTKVTYKNPMRCGVLTRKCLFTVLYKMSHFKQWCKIITEQMLADLANDLELLKRIKTCDETWMYGYDIKA